MRILHVIPSLGPLRGGPSVMAQAVTTDLARAGLEVHLATTDDNGPGRLPVLLGQPLLENGVTHWYFPRQTRFYTASWALLPWLNQHVASFDLVHIHALFSYTSIVSAMAAARAGVPYIVRPLGSLNHWGMYNRRPLLKRVSFQLIERRVLAGAAAVHVASQQERHEAAHFGHWRSVVIPNPVALTPAVVRQQTAALRARYPWLVGRTVVLFLSRLDAKKGLDLLLPAFAAAHVRCPELALVVAGAGDPAFVATVHAQAERLGIAQHTLWAGQLAGAAKLAALADADLFVLPSYSENFGNAAAEALAAGLPVIISDQTALHPDVSAAAAGLVVPCREQPLRNALLLLARNPALRAQMGERGQRLAQERYAPEAITAQLIALYHSLTTTAIQEASL